MLCYLPLAHIFELGNELVALSCGAKLAYACPRSLSNDLALPCGAFEAFQPTAMVAVPKVLDVLRKGILTKVRRASSPCLCTPCTRAHAHSTGGWEEGGRLRW